jgi:hypothetical protein
MIKDYTDYGLIGDLILKLAIQNKEIQYNGHKYVSEYIETSDTGTKCYYIYRTDNWDEFAYAVDINEKDGVFEVDTGSWLETA